MPARRTRLWQAGTLLFLMYAEVAELADALDSGSSGEYSLWGFKSPLRHQSIQGVS